MDEIYRHYALLLSRIESGTFVVPKRWEKPTPETSACNHESAGIWIAPCHPVSRFALCRMRPPRGQRRARTVSRTQQGLVGSGFRLAANSGIDLLRNPVDYNQSVHQYRTCVMARSILSQSASKKRARHCSISF